MKTLVVLLPFLVAAQEPKWTTVADKRKSETFRSLILTDIVRHLPESAGNRYDFDDPLTHGHEATHGVNSSLTVYGKKYGFYIGGNKAFITTGPKIKLEDVARFVPDSLRGSRYQTYLVKQAKEQTGLVNGQLVKLGHYNDDPLYVFNEWTAYTNEGSIGLELAALKLEPKVKSDVMVGQLELAIYAAALAVAVKELDPGFWKDNRDFRLFMVHELRRSIGNFKKSQSIAAFQWDTDLLKTWASSADASKLRAILTELGVGSLME